MKINGPQFVVLFLLFRINDELKSMNNDILMIYNSRKAFGRRINERKNR